MRVVSLAFLLAACATPAVSSGDLPSREGAEAALEGWDNGCWYMSMSDPELDCVAGPVRSLRSLRCRADEAANFPRRVLCRFSGTWVWPRGFRPARRFGPECVYLFRLDGGGWRVESFPDADVCEF